MSSVLQFFIWIPFAGFLISLLIPHKKESMISGIAIFATGFTFLYSAAFVAGWLLNGHPILDIKHMVLFQSEDFQIFIDFFFDKTTAVFVLVGSLLAFIVCLFSKYYMHRDEGFKRFFNVILLFFGSYNLIIFAGNFETLFIGWEFLGICSFLLIAFYRDRYLPVKNGLKVISIYRLSDVCLILAMWMSHHLWHKNVLFSEFNNAGLVQEHLSTHSWSGFFIALMILIAAAIKSAQLPFTSWLPRAMEGPTSSSAIFYGSLSVHIGVFLLLRTYPFWESFLSIKMLIILTGASTSLIANGIAKVQSSVKTQIAYSSIVQIGLIFIEIALGLHILALIHFSGNSLLRTYQLLVSPSVLSYRIHDMFFSFVPKVNTNTGSFMNKMNNTFYMLSVKEWNIDFLHYHVLWNPFKWLGKRLRFMNSVISVFLLVIVYLLGLYCHLFPGNAEGLLPGFLPDLFSLIGLLIVLKAFSEKGDAMNAWFFTIAGQLFIALSIALLNENFGQNHILVYMSGAVFAGIIGYFCLKRIRSIDNDIRLDRFHGYSYEQPALGFIFLLSSLALIGLPFTPAFIGVDLMFSHIHESEGLLVVFTALSFIFVELSIIRIYARVFMGQHKKAYHPIAFRSS